LPFYFDVRFIDAVALVRWLQVLPTTLTQLRCEGLDPPPDTAGVHPESSLRQQLGHVLVCQRIIANTNELRSRSPGPDIVDP
jgi:hypothetical protein